MREHTPGPWRIFQTTGEPPFYVIGIGRESGEGITDGNVGLGIWDADSPEALANAHLIAAAPDLLMVSAWLLRLIDAPELKRGTEAFEEHRMELRLACDAARAAIAKAKP